MAWSDISSGETLTESAPGSGAEGAWILLAPGELIQFFFDRIDVTPADEWFLEVQGSLDPNDATKFPDGPLAKNVYSSLVLRPNPLSIQGSFAVRPRIGNNQATPSDTIIVTVFFRKNGVAF